MTLVIIGCLVLCGVITTIIADDQGRSPAAGFLLGLVLGPVGILIQLVRSSARRELDPRELAPESMDRCPRCSELIPLSAFICTHCGRDVLMPTVTRA